MLRYYYIHWKEDDPSGVAYGPEESDLFILPEEGFVRTWAALQFTLKDGDYGDYLANDKGCPLCSARLKNIMETTRSQSDALQWLDVTVISETGEVRDYYILHFTRSFEVLDRSRTIFAGGDFVVKAVIDIKSVGTHQIFTFPTGGGKRMILSEQVKKAIEAGGCTGLEFSKVPTAN